VKVFASFPTFSAHLDFYRLSTSFLAMSASTQSRLYIRVLEATGITPASTCHYCHPYIRVSDGHFTIRSRAVDSHVNPHWNQDLYFRHLDENFTDLVFDLVNCDPFGTDTKLASCTLSAAHLALGTFTDDWFPFLPGPDLQVHMILHRPALFEPPFHEEPKSNGQIELSGGPREIFAGYNGADQELDRVYRDLIGQGHPPQSGPRMQRAVESWIQGFGDGHLGGAEGPYFGEMAGALRMMELDIVTGPNNEEEEEDRCELSSEREEDSESGVVERKPPWLFSRS
jgi:hypothetical protein